MQRPKAIYGLKNVFGCTVPGAKSIKTGAEGSREISTSTTSVEQ